MAFLNDAPNVFGVGAPHASHEDVEEGTLGISFQPLEEYQSIAGGRLEDYEPYVGRDALQAIKRLAGPLEGRGWVNLNSTFVGGGVAEMLRSIVPLAQQCGIDARWCVIRGSEEFFQVTKKLHNMLQGMDLPISLEEIFGAYLDTIEENANNTLIAADLVVVHDPQPAAMVMNATLLGNVLWRCHIDTSAPAKLVWRFLLPYINQCAGAVFTMPEFVGPGLKIPLYEIAPSIDPLAKKNHHYTEKEALDILDPLFHEGCVDPGRPILAAVSRYDVHKNQATILKAFQRMRAEKQWDPMPYLIFLGNTASDDPEGKAVLAQLEDEADGDPQVRFWVNVENNDQVVGALMRLARGLVHVSTREGFGLVVTEAMWQGTPVIGSRVGGITKQVLHGTNGFLVDDPLNVEELASKMALLLEEEEKAVALGRSGREHVRHHFLLPELLKKYLVLLRYYSGVSRELPPFRLSDVSMSDILHALRLRHPLVPDLTSNNGNGVP